MSANPRIEELRRRIQKDPASIAFAQLAEEHRRAGECEDAISVCRAGLAKHPAYLSARITLGRALLEVARLDEAATEFEYVRKAAPDNLTAIRELAEIHQRRRLAVHQSRSAQVEVEEPPPVEIVVEPEPPYEMSSLPPPEPEPPTDPVVDELEAWLLALDADRDTRPSRI